AIVGKRQRADVAFLRRRTTQLDARSAVARAGRELERQEEIGAARQRPGSEGLKLRRDVFARETLAVRSGETSLELLRGERFHARGRLTDGLLGAGEPRGQNRHPNTD